MSNKITPMLLIVLGGVVVGAVDQPHGPVGDMAALLEVLRSSAARNEYYSYMKRNFFGKKDAGAGSGEDAANEYYKRLRESTPEQIGLLEGHVQAHAIDQFAEKKVYDNIVANVRATKPGLSEEEQQVYANQVYLDWKKLPEDPAYIKYTSEHALYRARKKAEIDDSFMNNLVLFAQENILQPWSKFNAEHAPEINAAAKFLVIASAAAFIFNKVGGTEYVRNKIKEAFARPTIYTVRRHRKSWFGKKPTDLISEDDLVLAPQTSKQVRELIFLIKRRYHMSKTSKLKFAFPHVLLFGPPGTGKTSIAQMIADQSLGDNGQPMNFIRLMASDFMQIKKEGDRIAVLKEMFNKARSMGNTIIFLDEIDGMVGQRGKDNEGGNRGFLDHLLDEMATPSTRFMVVAATNHSERIDTALMSRFRRKIKVDLPTLSLRKMILDKKIDQELIHRGYQSILDTNAIAALMVGDSGRDLETFVTRLRDRLDFDQLDTATPEIAQVILREMGKLPSQEGDSDAFESY